MALEAKFGDLTGEVVGSNPGVTVSWPVWAVPIERAVAKYVVGGGQDRGGDGADGLLRSSTRAEALELGL